MKRSFLIVVLSATVSLVCAWKAEAVRCTNSSFQCNFVFPNGECCQRLASVPGLAPKDEYEIAQWVQWSNIDCGIKKNTAYFIPCFGVEGSTCGTKQASPVCTN